MAYIEDKLHCGVTDIDELVMAPLHTLKLEIRC